MELKIRSEKVASQAWSSLLSIFINPKEVAKLREKNQWPNISTDTLNQITSSVERVDGGIWVNITVPFADLPNDFQGVFSSFGRRIKEVEETDEEWVVKIGCSNWPTWANMAGHAYLYSDHWEYVTGSEKGRWIFDYDSDVIVFSGYRNSFLRGQNDMFVWLAEDIEVLEIATSMPSMRLIFKGVDITPEVVRQTGEIVDEILVPLHDSGGDDHPRVWNF